MKSSVLTLAINIGNGHHYATCSEQNVWEKTMVLSKQAVFKC